MPKPASFQDQLARILTLAKTRVLVGDGPQVTYRCPLCRDTGIEDIESGIVRTVGSDLLAGVEVDASQTHVARICSGPHKVGCPWRAWKATPGPSMGAPSKRKPL